MQRLPCCRGAGIPLRFSLSNFLSSYSAVPFPSCLPFASIFGWFHFGSHIAPNVRAFLFSLRFSIRELSGLFSLRTSFLCIMTTARSHGDHPPCDDPAAERNFAANLIWFLFRTATKQNDTCRDFVCKSSLHPLPRPPPTGTEPAAVERGARGGVARV